MVSNPEYSVILECVCYRYSFFCNTVGQLVVVNQNQNYACLLATCQAIPSQSLPHFLIQLKLYPV